MHADPPRITRREALQLVATATAALSLLEPPLFGAPALAAQPYGTDPSLNKAYNPGDLWPLTLSAAEKSTTKALADLILPADGQSPAASEVGSVEFVDEWISAPYPLQQTDRKILLEGIAWIDAESARRFSKPFAQLAGPQQSAIADDICRLDQARAEHQLAAQFFARLRTLVAGGFYATRQGWKDIGYVGNVPLVKFDGPPKAVLDKLGV